MTKNQGPQAGTVAARLAELQKLGEQDAEFARRIGLTPQNWNNLKTGKQRSVSVETLADIVRHLKLSEADLYYIVTGKKKPPHYGSTDAQRIVERIREMIHPLPAPLRPMPKRSRRKDDV